MIARWENEGGAVDREARTMKTGPRDHTPRSAAVLLTDALECLDLIEPLTAREPIRLMLRAGIEQCAMSRSLLGKPVVFVLQLAQTLVDEGRHRSERPGS